MEAITNTKELYTRLTDELAAGHAAAVLSRYYAPDGATGAGDFIEKSLYSERDPAAWRALLEIIAKPGVVCDGPVIYVKGNTAISKIRGGGNEFERSGGDETRHRSLSLLAIEHYLPKPRMIILGGGHIALSLTKMAKLADFYVTVFDDRPAFANPARFPESDEVICDDFSRVMERINVRASDYVVIVTRGHKHDTECLEGVLKGTTPVYIGMIGSRRRVAIVLRQLEETGYDKALLGEIHTPIGLKIGAVTPAEISVAILSEVIEAKRKGFDKAKRRSSDKAKCKGFDKAKLRDSDKAKCRGFDKAGATAKSEHGTKITLTSDIEIAEWLAKHGDEADALLTILTTNGPVPRETGAKMAISYEGRTAGTIGGGCAESDVMQDARTIIRAGGWMTKTVDMTDSAEDDGMVCGGTMTVIIEKSLKV